MEQRQALSYYIIPSFICPPPHSLLYRCQSWEAGSQSSQGTCNRGKMFPSGPILGKAVKLAIYSTKGRKNYDEIGHTVNY